MLSPSIVLHYPSRWITPPHPARDMARRDVAAWLRDLGVVATPRAERVLDAMNVGAYGGAPFSFAGYDDLVTVMRALTLWIFHDDAIEGLGVESPRSIVEALRDAEGQPRSDNPYLRGWQDIGRRFGAKMSRSWLSRHAERFTEWLASVGDEARAVTEARRTGRSPSFEAYMELRAANIGALPVFCWIEYALGRELGAAMLNDPAVARAERLAAELIAFQNDIAGLDKDAEEGWLNAVISKAADDNVPIEEAIVRVAALHDTTARQLDALGEGLIERHGPDGRAWLRALTRIIAGFAAWHTSTVRYAATLPNGQRVSISVAAYEPASMRRAPMSTRLLRDAAPPSSA